MKDPTCLNEDPTAKTQCSQQQQKIIIIIKKSWDLFTISYISVYNYLKIKGLNCLNEGEILTFSGEQKQRIHH